MSISDENKNNENKNKSRKDVNEFLPKFLTKQMVEKRASSYNNLQHLGMTSTISVVNCNGTATLMNINDNILTKEKQRVPNSAVSNTTSLSRLNNSFTTKQNDGALGFSKIEDVIYDDSALVNYQTRLKGNVEKAFRPVFMKKKHK